MDRDWQIRIEGKIDTLLVTSTTQQKDIEYHIKRTDLLEEKVTLLRSNVGWVIWLKEGSKILLVLGAVAAAIAAISKLVWHL